MDVHQGKPAMIDTSLNTRGQLGQSESQKFTLWHDGLMKAC